MDKYSDDQLTLMAEVLARKDVLRWCDSHGVQADKSKRPVLKLLKTMNESKPKQLRDFIKSNS